MPLDYSGGFTEAVAALGDYEKAGLDIVSVPEAYSFDAVSQLGFLAARTERIEIASGILPIYTRTPTLTAMTAAGLDFLSGGRFTLGLGASGPQVIEGFHGVPYDAPLARTREVVEICRAVWRREKVEYEGRHYTLPLPPERGTGLGKPLKIINRLVRERIPIVLAAIGPRNVELAAEIAEGWEPLFHHPEKAGEVWGRALAQGRAKRAPELGELDVVVGAPLAIGEDTDGLLDLMRPMYALYIGGKKKEAEAAVPGDLLRAAALVGSAGHVRERLAAYAQAGVTTLKVTPLAADHRSRVAAIEQLREWAS
ncbi:LLM class F420-dependent oxidoreductase [Parafrankia sp. BMG5.11]|nr:LLM class F420-dependent oxidoreductase [Parafrankia sp. BMG5.11]TCJ32609.1 LLM class F420-dependent oxidoreductase [Parafrankia sp. BMG5.11]